MPDIQFHFDPVCPFAWVTSKWVRRVAELRDLTVDWRFISLRLLNRDRDYDAEFPRGYERGHTAGLRLLRVAAAVRDAHGGDAVGALYAAYGNAMFECEPPEDARAHHEARGTPAMVLPILDGLGLPLDLVAALDETSWDDVISEETEAALALTGRDVGTPIVQFRPPDGQAFFGPVISRVPSDEDALRLWDAVVELASIPGFAELKRSLREPLVLPVFGRS